MKICVIPVGPVYSPLYFPVFSVFPVVYILWG